MDEVKTKFLRSFEGVKEAVRTHTLGKNPRAAESPRASRFSSSAKVFYLFVSHHGLESDGEEGEKGYLRNFLAMSNLVHRVGLVMHDGVHDAPENRKNS